MVKGLAAEFAQYGVRVNALEPGFCNTEQTSGMEKKIRDFQASSVPMGRFSEPKEQAEPAAFLLSDLAQYITGACVQCFLCDAYPEVVCDPTVASLSTKTEIVLPAPCCTCSQPRAVLIAMLFQPFLLCCDNVCLARGVHAQWCACLACPRTNRDDQLSYAFPLYSRRNAAGKTPCAVSA